MIDFYKKGVRSPVEVQPLFYLKDWRTKDFSAISMIAKTGYPILLSAEEIQVCSEVDLLLSVFTENQLQILSTEVEGSKSALELVIENCVKNSWTHLVVVNQYSDEIIQSLLEALREIKESPQQSICLVPTEKSETRNHPIVKRLLEIGDSDYRNYISELCVYPVSFVQNLKLRKSDPLQHLKILLHIARNKRSVRKKPVKYNAKIKVLGISDRIRATFYEWCLLALTSLHYSNRPLHSALSLAMGVFLACTPFYGLQTLLIIAASLIFRLSFPIAFLGSQVSLPPIYSLVVPLELYVGFKVTGESFSVDGPWIQVAQTHFVSWTIGALLVGLFLATILGIIWYWLQKDSMSKVKGNLK